MFLRPGTGAITVNYRAVEQAFPTESVRTIIRQPLSSPRRRTSSTSSSGSRAAASRAQAEAIRLGIARALIEFNRELRPALKAAGLLTRDARIKERKKYGLLGARKAPQYHKR